MDVAFISFNTICGMERKYMNYSRLEIEKKQKELTSTSVKMQYRVKEWIEVLLRFWHSCFCFVLRIYCNRSGTWISRQCT